MNLDANTWSRVTEIFERVVELEPPRRARAIAGFNPDPDVRNWLEQLLNAHDDPDEVLIDRTVQGVIQALSRELPAETEALPERIGPWRLVRELGCGGMGRVALGQRADGRYDQQVAVKLLAGHMLGPEDNALMEREIRLLARLEHPGIVRLIDGGVDTGGRPYLVMEYVNGEPIDQWCQKRGATLDQRIALIRQVANAVAHAHRRLVVHTDIKPGNVLVTEQGRVRLLDFGVGALLREHTAVHDDVPRCSPAWCAPEQLHGAAPDVSQDVYGLGALMLRLLTGRRARGGSEVTRWLGGLPETAEAPPMPSENLLPGIPARRVRGDLDAICQRSLAHAPDHRYQSIETLDADLDRWRRDRPVSARPLGAPARLGRWARRHWMPISAIGIAGVALTVGMIAARHGADLAEASAERAMAQAQRADSVRDLVLDLFRAADPLRAGGAELSTRQVLSGAGEALSRNPELTPDVRLEVLNVVADVQRVLGWTDDAERMLAAAVRLIDERPSLSNEARAETWLQHALLKTHRKDFEAANEWLRRVHEQLDDHSSDPARRILARTFAQEGSIHAQMSRHVEAEIALDKAERILVGLDPRMLEIESLVASSRGVSAYRRDDFETALSHMRRTLELKRELGNEHQASAVVTLGNMAAVAAQLGRLEESLNWDREAVEIARATWPEGHAQIGRALYALGDTLRQTGRYSEALTNLSEAALILRAAGMDADYELVELTRARTLFAAGDYPGALASTSAIRAGLAERWGDASREALLSLELELGARAQLGENPIPALRPEIERRFAALAESQRANAMADLLRWRLADIELNLKRPGRVEAWLGFERDQAPEPEHASVLLRWLAIRQRRDLTLGESPDLDREQRLLSALELSGSNVDARAYAWCVLAESAMAHNADKRLSRAVEALDGITRERSLSDEMARRVLTMRQTLMGG